MKNYNKKNIYISVFFLFFLVLFTNSFHDYNQILSFGGADGYSYFEISKNSPFISKSSIQPIHAERFIIPYIIGLISKIFNFEILIIYRLVVILLIILIIIQFLDYLYKYNTNTKIIFCLTSIIILNPYLTRFYISNPLIINDLFFIYGSIISIKGVNNKDKLIFFFGLLVASIARQSAAAIIISIFIVQFFDKNFFLKKKDILISLLLFSIIYSMGYIYSNQIPYTQSRTDQYFVTLFGLLTEEVSMDKLILFFTWPFLSFGPLIFFFLIFIKEIKLERKRVDLNLFILTYCILVIIQPILQGYDVTGKNIIRLTTYSFIPLILLSIQNARFRKNLNYGYYITFFIIIIWTCHPTFSKFKFLEILKF